MLFQTKILLQGKAPGVLILFGVYGTQKHKKVVKHLELFLVVKILIEKTLSF